VTKDFDQKYSFNSGGLRLSVHANLECKSSLHSFAIHLKKSALHGSPKRLFFVYGFKFDWNLIQKMGTNLQNKKNILLGCTMHPRAYFIFFTFSNSLSSRNKNE
jgi:hypothetical protein